MPWGAATSKQLPIDRCRALLASQHLGVVAMSRRALPMAFPVAYALADQDLIVRVAADSELLPQMLNQVVTLAAYGHSDGQPIPDWLVTVTARAHRVSDADQLRRCRELALPTPGADDVCLRVPLDIVVGHERLTAPEVVRTV